MSSPLLAGNNFSAAGADLISILTAKGPLSVNQDALALQGTLCDGGKGSGDGAAISANRSTALSDDGGIWQASLLPPPHTHTPPIYHSPLLYTTLPSAQKLSLSLSPSLRPSFLAPPRRRPGQNR
jgi:hypothetical protein